MYQPPVRYCASASLVGTIGAKHPVGPFSNSVESQFAILEIDDFDVLSIGLASINGDLSVPTFQINLISVFAVINIPNSL